VSPRAAGQNIRLDASLVVGAATGVAPERSFCFFNEVHELVLQMIAGCITSGRETPGQRLNLVHAETV
jgi:hypothetical protein